MNRRSVLSMSCLVIAVLAGCTASSEIDDPPTSSGALTAVPCPDVSGTNTTRSLVVTDPEILAKFPLRRVVDKIRASANVASTETAGGIFKRWMKTFGASAAAGDCDDPNIDPRDYGLVCPRLPEAKLATISPFATTSAVTFEPVALFNRFDLAPNSGAHCGEYRVVYAMKSSSATITGRGFLIFEAAIANPNPAAGIESCLPIAQFWQALSADASVTSRGAKLENFYFNGTAVAGVAPVVQAVHYGLNAPTPTFGQIRTNFFIDNAQWQLREFKTRRSCTNAADPQTCTLNIGHVTVKTNPADELFAGTHTLAGDYRTEFAARLPALLATDVARIGFSTSDRFNEFESISQPGGLIGGVNYAATADAAMRAAVQTKLTALGSTLTVNNVLDRATTQTCGGCHQISNGKDLGGGKTWPSSGGFVHVDENSNLSSALTTTFLPRRKVVLEKFINDRCTPPDASAPAPRAASETVGGSAIGAAN